MNKIPTKAQFKENRENNNMTKNKKKSNKISTEKHH